MRGAINIAVLLTCYNRVEKTIACFESLFLSSSASFKFHVILVDDGSTDGTSEAILRKYPSVEIIKGDGSLYWNKGMHIAFQRAMEIGFDAYLWLNDDTILFPDAIQSMISTWLGFLSLDGRDSIVVGSTCDPETGSLTYGGVVSRGGVKRLRFSLVSPCSDPIECHTMNGNCVLVPHSVAKLVGNLDPAFAHAMGDTDYGLRARVAGVRILVAPGFIGECARNSIKGGFNDRSLPVRTRFKKILSPKGLPIKSWFIFTKRHAGPFWPIFFLWPYLKIVL